MSCEIYQDSMMKYFDGDLNDIEIAQFKQHLKSCKKCNDEFEGLNTILNCIEKDLVAEPPPDFEMQVMSRISTLEPEKKKPGILKIFLLGAGTIITLLMASALIYSILGISIFKLLSYMLSDSPMFSNIFESAGTAFEGGIASVIEYSKTIFEVAAVLAKTYYYFVVLVIVLVFALQWMVVGLVKQNMIRQKEILTNSH